MLLSYTGPAIANATVEFIAGDFPGQPVVYTGVNLTPGTVLSKVSENGWTIDATAHNDDRLGAKTTIKINGVSEVIHTSCSTPFRTGYPAPLDNPKGAPSPNWFVEDFTQR
jgi:hypothetical protein